MVNRVRVRQSATRRLASESSTSSRDSSSPFTSLAHRDRLPVFRLHSSRTDSLSGSYTSSKDFHAGESSADGRSSGAAALHPTSCRSHVNRLRMAGTVSVVQNARTQSLNATLHPVGDLSSPATAESAAGKLIW